MDISTEKYESDDSRPGPFLAVSQTIRNIIRWLTVFFVVTEEEQSKAGIYFGGEGRD